MANDLLVRILGDTKGLERSFARANQATATFGRNVDSTGAKLDKTTKRFSALSRGVGGLGGAIAAGAVIQGIRSVAEAAAESQQVLGQTRVALETTGKSWAQYGDTIKDTVKEQSRLGFDDEALLRTFSLFQRNTDDVSEALRRNVLAMDVARGRFIDLESAALLVNKAALGQAGALRRLGIDARKGADATELLALLQEKYGGAAKAASGDATTSFQRTQVAMENLQESLGTLLLPALELLSEHLQTAAEFATNLTDALRKIGSVQIPEIEIPFNITIGGSSIGDLGGKAFNVLKFTPLNPLFGLTIANSIADQFRDQAEKATPNLTKQIQDAGEKMVSDALGAVKPFGITELPTRGENFALQFGSGIDAAIDSAQALAKSTVAEGRERIAADKAKDAAEKAAEALKNRNEALRKLNEQREAAAKAAQQSAQFRALGLSGAGTELVPGVENLRRQLDTLTKRLADSDVKSKLTNRLEGVRKLLSGQFGKVTESTRAAIRDLFDAIRQEFDKGDEKLKRGPLTKTSSLNANKILDGLGLGPEAERELRARLSSFNSAGRSLGGATRPTGNFSSQPVEVTVNNTTTLDGEVVSRNTTRQQQKQKRRNPRQKRGPNSRSGI